MAMSLEDRIDSTHGMLIVVDMQNDFCHRQGAACKRGRDMDFVQNMIPRLIRLVEQARAHNFPICFVRTSGINGLTHRSGPNSKTQTCSLAPKAVGAPNFTPV